MFNPFREKKSFSWILPFIIAVYLPGAGPFADERTLSNPQAGAAAPPPPSKLEDKALQDRALLLQIEIAETEKTLEGERKALVANREFLDSRRARLSELKLPVPAPPPPLKEGATAVEAAKAFQSHREARAALLYDSLRILDELQGGLKERLKRLEAAQAAAKSLEDLIMELQPVAIELERRIAAGSLPAVKPPESFSAAGLVQRRSRIGEWIQDFQTEALSIQGELQALPDRIQEAQASVSEAQRLLAEASRAYIEERKREDIAKEIAGKDPSSLAALFLASESERARLYESFSLAKKDIDEALGASGKAAEELQALAPPNPEKIAIESSVDRVAAAERTLKAAEETAAYYGLRAKSLGLEKTALEQLLEKAAAAFKEAAVLDENLLRMQVMADRLGSLVRDGKLPAETLPAKVKPEALKALRAGLAKASAGFAACEKTSRARLEQLPALTKEALAAVTAERDRIPGLRDAYLAAKESARFIQEVEGLETPEVIKRFEEAFEGRKDGEGNIGEARRRVQKEETAIEIAESQLRKLEDPLFRNAQLQNPGKRQEILERLSRIASAAKLAEGPPGTPPVAAPKPAASEPGRTAADEKTAPPQGSPANLVATLEANANSLSSRVRVLEQRTRQRAELSRLLGRLGEALAELIKEYSETIELANRAYGAALVLQARASVEQLKDDELNKKITLSLDRDRIVNFEMELAGLQKRRGALDNRVNGFRDEEEKEGMKRGLLSSVLAVEARKLEAYRRIDELQARFDLDPSKLSDIEAKRLDQEVIRRMEDEQAWFELILGLFHSDRAMELEQLLHGYYRDLIILEKKLENIEAQKSETDRLIRLAEEERTMIMEMLPIPKTELVILKAEDAAARIRAGLNKPTNETLLADFQAAGREPPQAPAVIDPDALEPAADRLFDSRMRVYATEIWVRDLERRLSRLGIDGEVAIHRDSLGAHEARSDALLREIKRLSGQTAEDLQNLDPGENPETEADKIRFLNGEIGLIRSERLKALIRAGAMAVFSLIAIPLAALLLVRVTGKLGNRIVKKVREGGDEGSLEREQRARTLVTVFKATLTTVVSVVAGIYMLKQFRIDVTPILASAGVAGLAIAFGAQTLIRDFFAGFFMLLENQYKIGDVIKIGDTGGVVERITLRLTVLRDLQGVVHFIPNGTVQQVSNMTKGWSRAVLEIGVAYKEDVDQVMKVLRRVGEEMRGDPVFGPKLLEAPEVPGVEQFGDSAVTVRMLFKTRPGEQWNTAREARRRIKQAFDAAGIEIPFPQRVVYHIYPKGKGSAPELERPGTDPKAGD
ncbi:MAG: mechanosensitive ion channel [Planctomycetes bacterium]|nr:mechanosensitive ion channel [Planctomycetota bacterium]